jgi:hypothetical protein
MGIRGVLSLAASVAAVLCLWAATAASAAVLYDQTDGQGIPAILSTEEAPPRDTQVADDFVVPAGQSWRIEQVDVAGMTIGSPPSLVNVFIYADAGVVPGAELFAATDVPASGGPNYSVPFAGAPILSAGSYWISIQQANGAVGNEWYWRESAVLHGDGAVYRNPSGGSNPCTVWTPRLTCFPSPPNPSVPDQIFKLSGTAIPVNEFTLGAPRRKRNGSAVLPATFPNPGSVVIADAGLAGKSGDATAAKRRARIKGMTLSVPAGAADLAIKPSKSSKRTLARGGKVKVSVAVTFTPTGGTPLTRTTGLKLRRKSAR